jgi:phosphatidylinositol alpha-1,6-mannosyltransferase
MRVLIVTNDYPPAAGGIQRYVADLLQRVPWDVHVLAPRADTPSDPRVVRYDRALLPTGAVANWTAAVARDLRPDLMLFAAFPLGLIAPAVARRTGVPYAIFLHGAEVTIPAAIPVLRSRYETALEHAAARFAVSHYTAENIEQHFDVPITWIGAGVDTDVFTPNPAPHDGFVVGCVGRFVRRKGHDRVIAAVAALRARGVDARALMVGWGSGERRLRGLAKNTPTRFVIGGSRTEVLDAYRHMDAFAMPVRSRLAGLEVEGLGLVFLEAAACGLPVIAGTSGGAPETVQDGVSGRIVRTQGGLIGALEDLARNPGVRVSMGLAGRERVERDYTWSAVIDRMHSALPDV